MLADLDPHRPVVGLDEVVAGAPALTRVDRKYLVTREAATDLLHALDDPWRTLAVGGRRTTHYRSTYLDTPDLMTVRDHVQGRRRRWKARTRTYLEDGLRRVEVKAKDGRGRTVKTQAEASGEGPFSLRDRAFVVDTLAGHGLAVDGAALVPTATITHERLTLARLDDQPGRMTLDADLTCVLGDRSLRLDPGLVLVETKGDLRPGEPDLVLRTLGQRPCSFSKYAATGALLRADVPDNDVRRLLGRVLHLHPHAPTTWSRTA